MKTPASKTWSLSPQSDGRLYSYPEGHSPSVGDGASDGNPFVVSGSGFGVKATPAPKVWDSCNHSQAVSALWGTGQWPRLADGADPQAAIGYKTPAEAQGPPTIRADVQRYLSGAHMLPNGPYTGGNVGVWEVYPPPAYPYYSYWSYYFRLGDDFACMTTMSSSDGTNWHIAWDTGDIYAWNVAVPQLSTPQRIGLSGPQAAPYRRFAWTVGPPGANPVTANIQTGNAPDSANGSTWQGQWWTLPYYQQGGRDPVTTAPYGIPSGTVLYFSWADCNADGTLIGSWSSPIAYQNDNNYKQGGFASGTNIYDNDHYYWASSSGWNVHDVDLQPRSGMGMSWVPAPPNPDNNGHSIFYWDNVLNYCVEKWQKIEVEARYTDQSSGFLNVSFDGVRTIYYEGPTDVFTSLVSRADGIGGYLRGVLGAAQNRNFATVYYDREISPVKRLLLCNNPVFASATIREPQPASVWTDSTITATMNRGMLPLGTAYAFVYDGTTAVPAGTIEVLP